MNPEPVTVSVNSASPAVAELGEMELIEGAGFVTEMAAVPEAPPPLAVIVALPALTPVTNPVELTVATALPELDQVNDCPDWTFPFASRKVANSWRVPATEIVADDGLTETEGSEPGPTTLVSTSEHPTSNTGTRAMKKNVWKRM